jgi:hypothetical protein
MDLLTVLTAGVSAEVVDTTATGSGIVDEDQNNKSTMAKSQANMGSNK